MAAMALVAGGTLLAEVALTRVLSVSLYHHFAFLVVSTALLGTGVAGAFVSASGRLTRIDGAALAAVGALILAVGLPVCFTLAQLAALEPLSLASSPLEVAKLGLVYVLFAAPFFGSGLAIAVTLERNVGDAARLYAADLVGAGAGAFVALAALPAVGGIGAVVLGAALAAVAAVFFAEGRLRAIAGAVAVALVALAPFAEQVLPLHITASKVTRGGERFEDVLADPTRAKARTWNSLARLDEIDFGGGVVRLMIDAGVAAVRVPSPNQRPVASDATLGYELRPGARVLVIGAGAGWEVQEALAFGASRVDAVEVNPAIAARAPKALKTDPRVRWIVDEARSVAERSDERYDVIVMIHTISNAATSAGALHLAEDYLLTEEALETLLSRLSDGGLLFVTRPEAQIPRLLATLVAAGADVGAVYGWAERAATSSFYAALLIGRAPLAPDDHAEIVRRIEGRTGLRMLFTPAAPPSDALLAGVLGGETSTALEALARGRLDPATDDRPFFHQRRRFGELRWRDFVRTLGIERGARLALEDQPFAEIAAVLLLVETTIVGAIALLLPLAFARRIRAPRRRVAATFGYFSALGLGFMLVEIALVQRLGLLLGAPTLTFATVFAGLLVGAGIGSASSSRLRRPALAPLFAIVAATALALLLPAVLAFGAPLAAGARIGLALGIVLTTGGALGLAFPAGLRQIADTPGLVPWAFATNGLASIAGTVLALIGASSVGFTGVLLAGAGVYTIALLAGRRLGC